MTDDQKDAPFEVDELDDEALEDAAGGLVPSTNGGCTNDGCGGSENVDGCSNTNCAV